VRLSQSHKLLGIVFVCLLLASVYLTYAVFTKKFADYDEVSLQTSKIGLQLPERADVKIRGVIVGEVLDFDATAEGAEVTLGLYKGERETIPANVTGSIVPKTLFGEKYVSLEVPQDASADPIEPGATIERTEVAIEVEKVLSDLYPLLRTVQPAELNMTLNAMATALEGRGEMIGENLETVDSYLKRLNPQIPAIVEDLRLTAQVSDVYADVMPQIASILRNSVTTTSTLEGREDKLNALFTDVAAFSNTSRDFLNQNGDNIIRLGEVSAAQLEVLAKYSPEFPCLAAASSTRASSRPRRSAASRSTSSWSPCPTSRAATRPATRPGSARSAARPACGCPTRRGRSPTRSAPSPTWTTASTSPPARGPAGPRPATTATATAWPAAVRSRSCSSPCSDRRSGSPPRTCPTSACCWSAPWLEERR
jgi:virulence factor Mce-like protein